MTRFLRVLSLAVPLFYMPPSVLADRAHDLANQASAQKVATGCNPGTLNTQSCHEKFPTGCTDKQTQAYDPYLNFLKNQTPGAAIASTSVLGQTEFHTLEGKIPPGLTKRNHAGLASKFAPLGEGNIITVFAYLYFVQDTRKGSSSHPSPGETCNCKLTLPDSYDFHLGLGFDKTLASQIRQTRPQPNQSHPGAMEKTSVVAEMTPHTRGPKWTFARVNSLQGLQIKVVGQLMADNEHFNKGADCGHAQSKPGCWRSTVWEVHPVTQFFVCNIASGCDPSSPDSAWTSLDDVP